MRRLLIILVLFATAATAYAQAPARDYAAEAAALVSPEDVERWVREFSGLDSRVLGYPGNRAAAEVVTRRLEALGFARIDFSPYDNSPGAPRIPDRALMIDAFTAPVPVDRGAALDLPGRLDAPLVIYPLWPNLVRTPTLPRAGVTGHLVYVGKGTYAEMDGKRLDGAIALMDFNCGKNYVNVRDMGAQAIVFIEPEETHFSEASVKMLEMPVNIPRFWLKRVDAEKLLVAALGDKAVGCATFDKLLDAFTRAATGREGGLTIPARATCRMPWERAEGRNVYALVYGSDPVLRKDLIVVQTYYDSISMVPSLAPGADTTGGIAGLLELAKFLKEHPPRRSVLLLATGSHFVQWEGIADWMLRHGPRGGTEMNQDVDADGGSNGWTWALRGFFLALTALLTAVIATSTVRMTRLKRAAPDPASPEGFAVASPSAARRAEGLGSLRFVTALLLVPAALVAVLSLVEKPLAVATPEPLNLEPGVRMKFFFSLDLSGGSESFDLFLNDSALWDIVWDPTSHGPYMSQYIWRLRRLAREGQFDRTLGARVLNPADSTGRAATDPIPMASFMLDGTAILRTGNPALTLFTVEDLRDRVDTPLDRPERVNVANLAAQVRAAVALLAAAADRDDFLQQRTAQVIRDRAKQLTTRVVEANYRESFVADTPVIDAVVVYKQVFDYSTPGSLMNMGGVRGFRMGLTDAKGFAVNRFVQATGATSIAGKNVEVRAYRLSPDDGRIVYAPNRGEEGAKSYPLVVGASRPNTSHQVVAFACEPIDLYQVENPRYLRAVGSGGGSPPIVFDLDDVAPQEFGYDFLIEQDIRTGKTENTAVVYVKQAPPGQKPNRVKFILGSPVFGVEYLLTNTEEAHEDGRRRPEGVAFAARPEYRVPNSGLSFARDIIRIDDQRMERFAAYGVVKSYDAKPGAENERLALIHRRALDTLAAAEAALADCRYSDFRAELDQALGYEACAYPDVKGTANDIVKGFLFYCILLLPFAYFCERLFFGFGDVRKQLFGFAGFFLLIFGLMAVVHPVFRITDAPYVILLAFVILVLAVSVLAIIIAKFNEQMAKMRRAASKVHEADVGRLSATGTAVVLGISNMKKRKVRTTLTTLTLILLTFTVMSFTSVQTKTVYNQIPQSHRASYAGLLLRDRGWFALEDQALDQFRRHFAPKGTVIPRAWLAATNPDGQRNLSFNIATDAGATVDCQALTGMRPEESRALNLAALLVAGRWFETPDEPSVVLPSRVAFDLLGLTKQAVNDGTARVRLRGLDLAVVGVLDSARLDQARDLDDELYTPLDMATKSSFGGRIRSGMFNENIVEIAKLPHLAADSVAVVPFDVCRRLGGRVASAAVVFEDGYDFEPDLKSLLERVGMTVFMGRDGHVKAYSSIAITSPGNVATLVVPVLIAALIVLNTMMGSVHERAREIGIYSSVGLAPVHIAFLFLAESCVYAVMGAISGYLLGTMVGKGVAMLGIPGLTLNYSSMSAVFSTIVVMATVLLSTVYPAKMAANMAVPDVTRQWKFPEPKGDVLTFDFPFTVASRGVVGLLVFLDNYFASYREESIGSFYADHVRFYPVTDALGKGHVVELDCWLAPFDLSVSQNVQLRALPTEDEGITRIEMCITRLSGEAANWTRLNRGFLTLMRKQFLIWRTVPPETKDQYQLEGRKRLELGQEAL